jgi:hypothetical protein
MTVVLKFQGHSDDTFACTGPGIDIDRDNCASGKPIYMRVSHGEDALIVRGQYADGPAAGWSIAVAPADSADGEERHIPAWAMRIERSDREYSPMLVVDAPHGVSVALVDSKGNVEPRNQQERDTLVASLRAANAEQAKTISELRREFGRMASTADKFARA